VEGACGKHKTFWGTSKKRRKESTNHTKKVGAKKGGTGEGKKRGKRLRLWATRLDQGSVKKKKGKQAKGSFAQREIGGKKKRVAELYGGGLSKGKKMLKS